MLQGLGAGRFYHWEAIGGKEVRNGEDPVIISR